VNHDELVEVIQERLKKLPVDILASPLRDLFNRPKLSGRFGTILVADGIVNIDELWSEAAIESLFSQGLNKYHESGEEVTIDESEVHEVLSESADEAWPYEAFAKDAYRNLVSFIFGGGWGIDLHWMRPDAARAYICLPNDPEVQRPWSAIAALEPPSADIVRTFLIDLLGTDGEEYGLREDFPEGLLHSFPTEVSNTDSELVPRATLRDALVAFLALKQSGSDDDWRHSVEREMKVLFEQRLPTTRTDSDRAALVDEYLSWNDRAQERVRPSGSPAPEVGLAVESGLDVPLPSSFVLSGFDGSAVQVEPGTGRVVGEWVPVLKLGGKLESLDFPTPAELCRCCGQELLQSGSRWSVWFCSECKRRVRTLNERAGTCVVPVGRHSIMNGVFIRGGHVPDSVEIDGFTLQVRGLSWEIDRLAQWAAEIVRRNCAAAGLAGRALIPLREYLDAVQSINLYRKDSFLAMLAWWRA
jgi:hypothetical protein